jgi:Uma2 family endonuclease
MSVSYSRHHFSVEEFDRIVDAGVFREDDRLELIEGEILETSPIGKRHAGFVRKLTKTLERIVGDRSIVSVQNPILADDWSKPQPDIALLVPRADFYTAIDPAPRHVRVAIEVADTSFEYDTTVKVPLYARSGIREVWVIDAKARDIHVYWSPREGEYRRHLVFGKDATFISARFPGVAFVVSSLIP